MIIDCGICQVRGAACSDCVVSVLLGAPGEEIGALPSVEMDATHAQAIGALAQSGLVPPLRLVSGA
jgi:hypothetical protein